MGLPQLERCCFVFDLKTGNIIMGCINAFLSFLMLIFFITEAVTVKAVQDKEEVPNTDVELLRNIEIERQAALTGLFAMTIILIIMFLAKVAFDIFFVYGVISERAGIIKAYFIMLVVFFLLTMFIFFLNITNLHGWTIFFELLHIGLNIYVILLSHSFYKQLNSREEV